MVRQLEDRRVVSSRRKDRQVSTTISNQEGEDWDILCELAEKSSYEMVRVAVRRLIELNKIEIDKMKTSKTTGETV